MVSSFFIRLFGLLGFVHQHQKQASKQKLKLSALAQITKANKGSFFSVLFSPLGHLLLIHRFFFFLILSLSFVLFTSFPSYSQTISIGGQPIGGIQVDHSVSGQRPVLTKTPSGVPQVDINSPSQSGVSMNQFKQFDVDKKGVILNNSRKTINTQIGGVVLPNANMARGEASVIVNQVNSSNPSHLNGYVEVAGQKADVIIANPKGLSVNGGGFLNAGKVTLTAGKTSVNGNQITHTVDHGKISLSGKGLDVRGADYAALLAKGVEVNAAIYKGEGQLDIITGSNTISDKGDILSTKHKQSDQTVAIDTSSLGGMYAGKIRLVGTDKGLGVNNKGMIRANTLSLTVDGKLVNHGTIDAKDQQIKATEIQNQFSGKVNAKNYQWQAKKITNKGKIKVTGAKGLRIKSKAVKNARKGKITFKSAIKKQAASEKPKKTNSEEKAKEKTNAEEKEKANSSQLIADEVFDNQGEINGEGVLTLDSQKTFNQQGVLSAHHLILRTQGDFNQNGVFDVSDKLVLSADHIRLNAVNQNHRPVKTLLGHLERKGDFLFNAKNDIHTLGDIHQQGKGQLIFNAGRVINIGSAQRSTTLLGDQLKLMANQQVNVLGSDVKGKSSLLIESNDAVNFLANKQTSQSNNKKTGEQFTEHNYRLANISTEEGGDLSMTAKGHYQQIGAHVSSGGKGVIKVSSANIESVTDSKLSIKKSKVTQKGIEFSDKTEAIDSLKQAKSLVGKSENDRVNKVAQLNVDYLKTSKDKKLFDQKAKKTQQTATQTKESYDEALKQTIKKAVISAMGSLELLINGDKGLKLVGAEVYGLKGTKVVSHGAIDLEAAKQIHKTKSTHITQTKSEGKETVLNDQSSNHTTKALTSITDDRTQKTIRKTIHHNSVIGSDNSKTSVLAQSTLSLKGAHIKGKKIDFNAADLHVESLKDTEESTHSSYKQTLKYYDDQPNIVFSDTQKSNIKISHQQVNQVSSIQAKDGGYIGDIKGDVNLVGGFISSTTKANNLNLNQLSVGGKITKQSVINSLSYQGESTLAKSKLDLKGKEKSTHANNGIGYGRVEKSFSSKLIGDVTDYRTLKEALNQADVSKNKPDIDALNKELSLQAQITQLAGQWMPYEVANYAEEKRNTYIKKEALLAKINALLKKQLTKEARKYLLAEKAKIAGYVKDKKNNYADWAEGGRHRVAMHARIGYLLTGSKDGAKAAALIATLAPKLEAAGKHLSKEEKQLFNLRISELLAGKLSGEASLIASNIDWNNANLHGRDFNAIGRNTHAFSYGSHSNTSRSYNIGGSRHSAMNSFSQLSNNWSNRNRFANNGGGNGFNWHRGTQNAQNILNGNSSNTANIGSADRGFFFRAPAMSFEQAEKELTLEALRGVSDDFSHIAKNERARAYLNSIPGQGERTAEGQTFLGELDRNSDEFKNSLINIGSAVDNRELLGSIALSSKEHSVLSQIYHGAALERDKHVKAADKAEIIKALNGMLSLAKSYQAESVNAHRQKEDDRGSRLAAELSYMADGALLLNNNAKKYHRLEGVNQSSLNAFNQMFDAQSAVRKDQMLAISDFAMNFAGGGVGFVVKQGLKQGVKQSAKKSITQAKQALELRNKTKGKITIDGKAIGKNSKAKNKRVKMPTDDSQVKHIFDSKKVNKGHIAPKTDTSQKRAGKMFENVANNPNNRRLDIEKIRPDKQKAEIKIHTQNYRNGQVWTESRHNVIQDAGVNRKPK